jgi:hypothetical protein
MTTVPLTLPQQLYSPPTYCAMLLTSSDYLEDCIQTCIFLLTLRVHGRAC